MILDIFFTKNLEKVLVALCHFKQYTKVFVAVENVFNREIQKKKRKIFFLGSSNEK